MTPRVLGIDPSLSATGIAWADQGTCTTGGLNGDQRLWGIWHTVTLLALGKDPLAGPGLIDLAVVEAPFEAGTGSARSGMAHGVIRLALLQAMVPYALVPPANVKMYATGKGNASKPDLRLALFERTGINLRDPDQVDAWWLRAMGMDALGAPILTLPQTHRRALNKIAWPTTETRTA